MTYTHMYSVVQRSAVAFGVILALFLFFGLTSAQANQDPVDCDANGVGLSLSVYRADQTTVISGGATVESGESVYYRATLSHLGSTNCNFSGGSLSIVTPDSVSHELTNPVPLVSAGSPHISSFQEYVVSETDVVGGNITASADYVGGESHTGEQHDDAEASVNRNTPYEDVDLVVTKTAVPAAEETYEWTIEKSVSPATWDLFVGDSGTSEYTIDLTKTLVGTTYTLSGVISIHNPAEFASANVTDVADVVDGVGAVVVDCPEATPFEVGPGETVECTYSTDLPNDSAGVNTATVTTDGDVNGDDGTANFDPSQVTPIVVGDSVSVDDTFDEGDAGPFSTSDSYSYTKVFTCGDGQGEFTGTGNTVNNTAEIIETQQSDDASVTVNCYDLEVTKTADTTFDREYDWSIVKTGDATELLLDADQSYLLGYDVTVDVLGFTDSNWMVSGEIEVSNSSPIDAVINSVADELSGVGALSADCGVVFPYTLVAGDTLVCTYGSALPDGAERENTATAVQQNYDYDEAEVATEAGTTDYDGSADVTFGAPTNVFDATVDVNDSLEGFLGTVALADAPVTFSYEREVGQIPIEECGETQIDNTATVTELDSQDESTDDHSVVVTVECAIGCTLTQGYWKTHSAEGPAPYDQEGWAALGDFDGDATEEEHEEGWGAGKPNWYDAFWTPPQGGNLWYKLVHQFQAAYLNVANGASAPDDVADALTEAEAWLLTYSPADKIKGKDAKSINDLHSLLASYNEGDVGPGHCDEDGTSQN